MGATFVPLKHRPAGPLLDAPKDARWRDFAKCAWHAYWQMVHTARLSHRLPSLLAAHRRVQSQHHRWTAPRKLWHADDMICRFMTQFEEWQSRAFDLDEVDGYDKAPDGLGKMDLRTAFELVPDRRRENLVIDLHAHNRFDLLKTLTRDRIFGREAKSEIRINKWMTDFKVDEVCRRSQLPDSIQPFDKLLGGLEPSNYTVHYPYPPNQYHSVPNCLCVLADGSPIFRLEVLDPKEVTRFRLAELLPPWWGESAAILTRPEPGEGEYDFPFHDLDIHEGDEFGVDKLMEVGDAAKAQLATRGERKFGK
jgi:hypothetical protein